MTQLYSLAVARKKVIDNVAKGQIFGEMASITHAPLAAADQPHRVPAAGEDQPGVPRVAA